MQLFYIILAWIVGIIFLTLTVITWYGFIIPISIGFLVFFILKYKSLK